MTREEAIEHVMNVFADRPSGPTGEEILEALGVAYAPQEFDCECTTACEHPHG